MLPVSLRYFYVTFEALTDLRRGNRMVVQNALAEDLNVAEISRQITRELGTPVIITFWKEIPAYQYLGLLSYCNDCETWLKNKRDGKPTTVLKLQKKEPTDETDHS